MIGTVHDWPYQKGLPVIMLLRNLWLEKGAVTAIVRPQTRPLFGIALYFVKWEVFLSNR